MRGCCVYGQIREMALSGMSSAIRPQAGTIFEESPLPLAKWIPAVWVIVNAKNGVSSCELARSLGVTQKTAWFMLHRIRLAIQEGSFVRDKMKGKIEVDESFIGGKARNMHHKARVRRGLVGKEGNRLKRQDGCDGPFGAR